MTHLRKVHKTLTKTDLLTALGHFHDAIRAEMKENNREIISHVEGRLTHEFTKVNGKFAKIDQTLVEMNTKLEAIMSGEVLVQKPQLVTMIRQLKSQGIKVDERRIFSTKG